MRKTKQVGHSFAGKPSVIAASTALSLMAAQTAYAQQAPKAATPAAEKVERIEGRRFGRDKEASWKIKTVRPHGYMFCLEPW